MAKALKASNTIAFQGEPGANSDMACRAAFPYMTTLACPTFEAAMGAVQAGRGGARHHSGRELDRRPRRRSAQPVAAHQAQDRRRAFPAGRALPGRPARRLAQVHQDGEEPRPGAVAVPQLPEEAPLRAAGSCRHRGRGARDRRDRRSRRGRHRLVAGRPDLQSQGAGEEHRGCRPQHHPHAGVFARPRPRSTGAPCSA